MTYEDFSKEILKWQGIFDGYPENDDAYRLYFGLISDKIKSLDVLFYCLDCHQKNENKLFPKPFELKKYVIEKPEGMEQLEKEVAIMIENNRKLKK